MATKLHGRSSASASPDKKRADTKAPSDIVDEQLARYRTMRDFGITAEPAGSKKDAARTRNPHALPFVIQKHAASHLHYDFRLGWNGVLKSWAVAKGPSYYVGDKRLAVEVEDHPMEYGGFEGIIPKGQYGGGTVMVWDQGTWESQPGHEDIDAGLRDGSLKFVMHGTKMHGKWTLIRMNTKPGEKSSRWSYSSKPNWLLIKEHDDFERGKDAPCVTEVEPNSAVTGRTLDQIAANEDHIWNSKETKTAGQAWFRNIEPSPSTKPAAAKQTKSATNNAIDSLPREKQPDFIPPQLALEGTGPPGDRGWLHELKLDGYRIQARKHGDDVKLLTRKGLDWTHRMRTIADALAKLSSNTATLDGEVVVLREDGTTSFADLQVSFENGAKHDLTYFAFDLLHHNGHNTRALPLIERKTLLAEVLTNAPDTIRFSEHLDTGGEAMFHKACELHAEGIISKRSDAPYKSGRSGDWLKSKCLREQEFVIGGYTLSSEGDDRIGSLLLGYYDAGKLIYAGRTGTGFTQKTKRSLLAQLVGLKSRAATFAKVPPEARRGAIWALPKLVAQVRFATWTADDFVRQAAFLGLREDKDATEVRRESAATQPTPKAQHIGTTKHHRSPKADADNASHKTSSPTRSTPTMRLTHPAKILDAETGLTKQELADYYWAIAPWMLPHIAGRPLSLVRCPEGSAKPCFFQKHTNTMLPPGVESVEVPDKKSGKPEPYITLNTLEALAGLAQMGVLEIHPWSSRNDDLEHPDRLIFDLDPDASIDWPIVCRAAAEVRARLKKAGLESFLKTTGGKGLHVVAPIEPKLGWTEVKDLAHKFVLGMERSNPALYLTKMSKAARTGKVYLDYLRNERGATAVAPYSPRARPGMLVSLPLPWSALKQPTRPTFAVKQFSDWKRLLSSNPWKGMSSLKQQIDPAKFANI